MLFIIPQTRHMEQSHGHLDEQPSLLSTCQGSALGTHSHFNAAWLLFFSETRGLREVTFLMGKLMDDRVWT